MSFLSFIGAGLSALFSGVCSAVSTVGSFMVDVAKALGTCGMEIVNAASVLSQGIAHLFGLSPEGENVEELGAKLKQDDVRQIEEGESIEDYLNYLRNEVELDKEKMEKMTLDERKECMVEGTSLLCGVIKEKCDVMLTPDFLEAVVKLKMPISEVKYLVDKFNSNEIDLDSYPKYFKGELNESDAKIVKAIIEESEQELHPEKTYGEIVFSMAEKRTAINAE